MKIYSISTPSHRILRDEWFLPSLCDGLPVEIIEAEQQGDGTIGNVAFNAIMLQKVHLILRAIEEQWGSWFIYSDVDVQFLRPFRSLAEQSLADVDICFQQDSPTGELCAGFFAARGNAPVRKLWQQVEERLAGDLTDHDQTWLNRILDPAVIGRGTDTPQWLRLRYQFLRLVRLKLKTKILCGFERSARLSLQSLTGCRIGLLPRDVFGAGTATGSGWNPAKPFPVPKTACVHHANYAAGLAAKIEQLVYVRNSLGPASQIRAPGVLGPQKQV